LLIFCPPALQNSILTQNTPANGHGPVAGGVGHQASPLINAESADHQTEM
jgi:hypothetical protein